MEALVNELENKITPKMPINRYACSPANEPAMQFHPPMNILFCLLGLRSNQLPGKPVFPDL